ncbi:MULTISPECIES: hypothetical protein [Nitrobacteraceae]|uniref:Uncharacterized protein n=3 Tax=Nitrobacteraceae TaxID=41294 RepID=A0A5P6PGS5_9BRAD|nr:MULTISPECIES: hypothetical protein [Nitrobacteraceae]MBE0702399.1 hypothetical protein [Afipia sp.]EKS26860.1 hypothetical protein HMPREF9697_03976 [Afipia felis ATCC 53690]MCS3731049.1 hypothetical protein [Bradyrhizobium betae]QFI77485.1 hypothetical protein F8237_34740 [Bradyrhizobium betae]SUW21297.1 Uncharacterised protein [Afipia felis]
MINLRLAALAGSITLALASPALSAEFGKPVMMQAVAVKTARQSNPLLYKLWSDLINKNEEHFASTGHSNPPESILFNEYSSAGRTILVSTIFLNQFCDAGPNSATSTALYASCPLRVAVVSGAEIQTVKNAKACFLDARPGSVLDLDPPPAGPDPKTTGTYSNLITKGNSIAVSTLQSDHAQPECAVTVPF